MGCKLRSSRRTRIASVGLGVSGSQGPAGVRRIHWHAIHMNAINLFVGMRYVQGGRRSSSPGEQYVCGSVTS